MTDPTLTPPPSSASTPTYRRQGWAITAGLGCMGLVIVLFGATAHMAIPVTLVLLATLGALACAIAILLVWRILRASMEAERHAAENQQRVRDFAELATEAFFDIDRAFHVTSVSSGGAGTGDRSLEGLGGRNWLRAVESGSIRELAGNHVGAMLQHLPFRAQRFRYMAEGGTTFWSISGKPLFDAQGAFTGYRAVAIDITDVIAAREQLLLARNQAERANRAKHTLVANMSHELRTPLNAILGFSEFIELQAGNGVGSLRHAGYARDIRVAGRRLLALVNDLLEYSCIEAGELVLGCEPFDVARAVEIARLVCQPQADALDVALRVETEPAPPLMLGDEPRFRQMLVNIMSNAIRFSPGASVRVTVILSLDSPEVLRIVVADTGIGMDAAGIARALRPFGQTDSGPNRKYEGAGLGVPLAKSLAELQGGSFDIESAPGEGACVTIVLPFRRAAALTAAPAMKAV
jgi:PAS domain S-box-containing protein